MKVAEDTSVGAQIAIAALTLCGWVGGWLIVLGGGFHHAPHRRAGYTVFVDGGPAGFMAALCFTWATIGVVALLKVHHSRVLGYVLGCGLVLVPPLWHLWAM